VTKSGTGRPQKVVEDAAKALETEKFNKHKNIWVTCQKCFIYFSNTFCDQFHTKNGCFWQDLFGILPLDIGSIYFYHLHGPWD
jgi:hypothetical protein